MVRQWKFWLAGLGLVAAPIAAQAQSCNSLVAQKSALQQRMTQLVADYPGTHLVIGMCTADASSVYQRTQDSNAATQEFTTCAGIGCLLAGFGNCTTVVTQWFQMAMEADALERRLKSC